MLHKIERYISKNLPSQALEKVKKATSTIPIDYTKEYNLKCNIT